MKRLLWLVVLALAGCGGGDPEPDNPVPGVNCQASPQVCR